MKENNREDAKHCAEGHQDAFNAGENETEVIRPALPQSPTGKNYGCRKNRPDQDEGRSDNDDDPSQKGRRRIAPIELAAEHGQTQDQVNDRNTGKASRNASDNIMKDSQEIKVMLVLIHDSSSNIANG